MGSLADAVLPLVRTRTDLHRWSAANSYGHGVHQAVALLRAAWAEVKKTRGALAGESEADQISGWQP